MPPTVAAQDTNKLNPRKSLFQMENVGSLRCSLGMAYVLRVGRRITPTRAGVNRIGRRKNVASPIASMFTLPFLAKASKRSMFVPTLSDCMFQGPTNAIELQRRRLSE
jgi:hypothetical protein